jgi:hypothetical protein
MVINPVGQGPWSFHLTHNRRPDVEPDHDIPRVAVEAEHPQVTFL